MNYHETDIDLERTLKNVFYLNKIEAVKKNLNFTYEQIGPQVPDYTRSDRNRLERILNILLQNAIKRTPEGKNQSGADRRRQIPAVYDLRRSRTFFHGKAKCSL